MSYRQMLTLAYRSMSDNPWVSSLLNHTDAPKQSLGRRLGVESNDTKNTYRIRRAIGYPTYQV